MTDDRAFVVPPGAWTGVALFAAAAMLFALGNRPYGYYESLRWIVLFASGFGIAASFKANRPGWAFLFLPLAIIFGPFGSVTLRRDIWFWLDLAGAAVFMAASVLLRWDLREGRLSAIAESTDGVIAFAIGFALAWLWASAGLGLAVLALSYLPGFDSLLDALRRQGFRGDATYLVASFVLALGWLIYESRRSGRR